MTSRLGREHKRTRQGRSNRAILAWSLLILAGCSAPPSQSPIDIPAPQQVPQDVPHEVTAEYTPGTVSTNPVIQQSRPNVLADTLIGTGQPGGADGPSSQAGLQSPEGIAVASDGTIYIAEPYAYRIRRVSPEGQVTTLAGGSTLPDRQDGQGAQARFMGPKDLVIDSNGDLLVVDFDGVRRVSPDGNVTTLPLKNPDGSEYQPIELFGIARDHLGRLYLSSTYWIDQVAVDGTVTRYAGNDGKGFADGQGSRAYFNLPRKLAMDAGSNLYVADYGNLRIRRISPDCTVSTIAGTGILGYTDGAAAQSRLNFPMGVACDAAGNVLIADTYNHTVRILSPDQQVRTIAGNNTAGFADGSGTILFDRPTDVAVRPDGGILVVDADNQRIRLLR